MQKIISFLFIFFILIISSSYVNASYHYIYDEKDEYPYIAYSPKLIKDLNGKYWMAYYLESQEGARISIISSYDLLVWSDPYYIEIEKYTYDDNEISFFQSRGGKYFLIWKHATEIETEIIGITSIDGLNWSSPEKYLDPVHDFSIIQKNDGDFLLAYSLGSDVYISNSSDLKTWNESIRITTDLHDMNDRNSNLFEDEEERIVLTYSSGPGQPSSFKIYLSTSLDGGTTWKKPVSITSSGYSFSSLCQNNNRTYLLSYSGEDGNIYVIHSKNLESWSNPEKSCIDLELDQRLNRPVIRYLVDGRTIIICDTGLHHNYGSILIFDLKNDIDNDQVRDDIDNFPLDPSASIDSDQDGYPDEWNNGKNEMDSNMGLRLDDFPEDPWAGVDSDGDGYPDEYNIDAMNRKDNPTLLIDLYPNDPNMNGYENMGGKSHSIWIYIIIGLLAFIIIIAIMLIFILLYLKHVKSEAS